MKRFGEKLRILRKRDGISLRKLASMLGHSSHSLVTYIEKGEKNPSLELAFNISRIFSVTLDSLVDDNLEIE